MLPFRLAEESGLFPDRRRAPFAVAHRLNGMRSAQMEGMFAVLHVEVIDGLVNILNLLRLHGVFEKRVLNPGIRRQVQENDPRRPVQTVCALETVKLILQDLRQFHGVI